MSQDENIDAGARQAFDAAVAGLDDATIKRLRLMRREALAASPTRPGMRLLPAAAFAIGVLAIGLTWRASSPALAPPVALPSTAPELAVDLASDEDAELYAWLGEAPVAAQGKPL